MNTISLRWLFIAISGIGLAVTSILNANGLWLAGAQFISVGLIGVAVICVAIRGRNAPFAIGFSVLSALSYWMRPSLDLGTFAQGVAEVSLPNELLRICLGLALGCAGGVVCQHLSADSAPRRMSLAMWLSIVVLFAGAAIFAGKVKTDRLVAEAYAQSSSGYGGGGGGGYGRPGGGVGYGPARGGAGYGTRRRVGGSP